MGDIWKPDIHMSPVIYGCSELIKVNYWLGEWKRWTLNINTGEWQFIEPIQQNQR
jgi:hypothetical protein